MLSTLIVAGLLTAVAIGTYLWQAAAFKVQQAEHPTTSSESDFYSRRHLRRGRVSLLLAVVAVSMVLGVWITNPLLLALYWFGVLALLMWIMLLAMVDASASHQFFQRARSRQLAEQAILHREALNRQGGADPRSDY